MRDPDWDEAVSGFVAAAADFAHLVGHVGDRWDAPGLGVWSVRDLIGHTTQGVMLLERALTLPAQTRELGSAADYFRAARGMPAARIADAGRRAGHQLGPDPATAAARIMERVPDAIGDHAPDGAVSTPVGGILLRDYVRTRTFELTVHALDLAAALELTPELSSIAMVQSLYVAAELAASDGDAGAVLLALTGRARLPERFCLV